MLINLRAQPLRDRQRTPEAVEAPAEPPQQTESSPSLWTSPLFNFSLTMPMFHGINSVYMNSLSQMSLSWAVARFLQAPTAAIPWLATFEGSTGFQFPDVAWVLKLPCFSSPWRPDLTGQQHSLGWRCWTPPTSSTLSLLMNNASKLILVLFSLIRDIAAKLPKLEGARGPPLAAGWPATGKWLASMLCTFRHFISYRGPQGHSNLNDSCLSKELR